MSASPQIQSTNVLDNLEGRAESGSIAAGEQILLTPYLTLACALLYMMASDGHLGEQESSHLQGVLGGDDKVLTYALHYVQSVPLEKFLVDAPEVLSTKDKWCILTNVSDALLSDGDADDAELALLAQLIAAFGVTEKAFRTSLTILKLKNDKTILGPYKGVKEDRQAMTPHFALAASLLYMLTADGSIGAEEIGQLEAVIGEFEGLQNVALKYVRSVKLKPFLDEAKATLKREQKLYILTNVCDSMLADGAVARLEDKVFMAMVNAFGFDEKSFAPYYQVFETKNFKPFECSFKHRSVFQHASGAEPEKVGLTPADLAANQGVWASLRVGDADMGTAISQTMQENIQSVEQSFGDQENVELVALNATDAFSLQKIQAEAFKASKAKIDENSDVAPNRQKLTLNQNSGEGEVLDLEASALNRQVLSVDALAPHLEPLDTEARVQNIHEVVGEVNERLDHFERQHFSFLQVGRAVRYDDSFAPIEETKTEANRQRVQQIDQERGDFLFTRDRGKGDAQAGVTEDHMSVKLHQSTVNPSQVNVFSPSVQHVSETGASRSSRERSDTPNRQSQDIGIQKVAGFHITRLHYLQLVTAFATLMFAAPISTKTSLNRSAVGPLLFLSQDQAADVRDLN